MIAVDTSAVIAVLRLEPDADRFIRRMVEAEACAMSAVSYFEASMVLTGRTRHAAEWRSLDELVRSIGIQIIPFDVELTSLARQGFLRFGKGRHPAGLNLGDCAAYALAKARSLPLLYKGMDFAKTDLAPALPP